MNRPLRRFALAAGIIAATTALACTDDRALSTEPLGARSYGVSLFPNLTGLPSGRVSYYLTRAGAQPSDSIVLDTLRGLDSLENGYYTVFVGDSAGSLESFQRATGTLTVTRLDTVIDPNTGDPTERRTTNTFTGTSAFKYGGPNNTMRLKIERPTSGLAAANTMRSVLITIESTADATTPSPFRRPIFDTRADGATALTGNGTTNIRETDVLKFGFYSTRSDSLYAFPRGLGRGRVYFRGNILTIEDSSLARPPRGYFYAAYAIRRDTGNVAIDTLYLGPLQSPYPRRLSLKDADSLIVDPIVQTSRPPQIIAAALRIDADTISGYGGENPFAGVSEILITLESKDKTEDRLGTGVVLRATVPTIVRNPPED